MRRRARLAVFLTVGALGARLPPIAHAAPPAADAAAEALFEEGRRLLAEGRPAEACPKLEESERLAPGVGTKFHLADCQERIGRTASAWATFLAAAAAASAQGRGDREAAARSRARALEPRLSRLVVDVANPARVPGLVVLRDGVALGAGQWGAAIPVDPGTHAVSATAAGKRGWSATVTVAAGATPSIVVPALEDAPVELGVAVAPPPTAIAGAATPAPRDGWSGQRVLAVVAGGAGLAGVGLGVAFGVQAIGKYNDSAPLCRNDVCESGGLDLRSQAFRAGTVSTVGLVAGGVLIVGGLVLWLTAPDGRRTAVLVPSPVGLRGTF